MACRASRVAKSACADASYYLFKTEMSIRAKSVGVVPNEISEAALRSSMVPSKGFSPK